MAGLAQDMANNFSGWENFPAIFAEYQKDLLEFASSNAKNFVTGRCAKIIDMFKDVDETQAAEPVKHLLKTVKYYKTQLHRLKFHDTPVAAE
jgi:hypothetical protein